MIQAKTRVTTRATLKIAEVQQAAATPPAAQTAATEAMLVLFSCGGVQARAFSF